MTGPVAHHNQITFQQAQDIVRARWEGSWETDGLGEFYIAPYGSETPTHWSVIFGAREALVDHDFDYVLMDAPITLVSKTTGEITELTFIANFPLVDSMTPVGDWPADDEDGPDSSGLAPGVAPGLVSAFGVTAADQLMALARERGLTMKADRLRCDDI